MTRRLITSTCLGALLVGCRAEAPTPSKLALSIDADGDGYAATVDCDDTDAAIHPAATETCDGVDNDCDAAIDEALLKLFWADRDADGYGNPSAEVWACDAGAGLADNAEDCDDRRADVSPGAIEVCDEVDNDCDDEVDEGTRLTFHEDRDSDGFGDPTSELEACEAPDGYVVDDTDCDDLDADRYPGNEEVCDGKDNDCNDNIDDNPSDLTVFWPDDDGDSFGDPTGDSAAACSAPEGWVVDSSDCDDGASAVNPAAPEVCDAIDNNCDGATDDVDADGDGFTDIACVDGTDCDDADSTINPGEAEICNDGIDQDCDGTSNACSFAGDVPVTNADAYFYGEAEVDRLGQGDPGVTNGGDLNGDGIDDLFVAAIFDDSSGTNAGAVHVFFGPISGLGAGVSTAGAHLEGDNDSDLFGRSIVAAGDVDDDGYDDVFISAQGDATNGDNTGAAYLVTGPISGGTFGVVDDGLAQTRFYGAAAGDLIADLAPAGDVNGDGYDDLLIAAQFLDAGGTTDGGGAYLIYGPTTTLTYDLGSPRSSDARFIGSSDGDEAGSSLWGGGDLNGDGTPDIIIAARYADPATGTAASDNGAVYVVHGPVSGDVDLDAADARLDGEAAGDELGYGAGVTLGGDLNRDGYIDLVAGARFNDRGGNKSGAAYVVLGPISTGTATDMSSADAIFVGEAAADQTGDSVAGPGDIDGDGSDDLLIGSGWNDAGSSDGGAGYLVLGPVSAVTGTVDLSSADARFVPEGDNDRLRITAGGDLDADGYADILIATQNNATNEATAGSQHGAVYLFYGIGL